MVEISNSTIAQETPMNRVLERTGRQETTVYLDMADFVLQVNILSIYLKKVYLKHIFI